MFKTNNYFSLRHFKKVLDDTMEIIYLFNQFKLILVFLPT